MIGAAANQERKRLRIAVVGAGIAGLATAWLLRPYHAVTVFESAPRLGGHVNTVDLTLGGRDIAVDTGFIVYNQRTYPLLTRLLAHLDVATQRSRMSFSASLGEAKVEYAGGSLAALLAQRRTLLRPPYLGMLIDLRRFNQLARRYLREEESDGPSLGQFLDRHGIGRSLADWYLLPMAASIWSTSVAQMRDYPARSFLAFFANHGLLTVGRRLAWRTISGGARRYVDRLAADLRSCLRLATPIVGVRRDAQGIELRDGQGTCHRFDQAVLACHADHSLAMIQDASLAERTILSAFRFQPNRAVLHRDPGLMPRRHEVWASWNYRAPTPEKPGARVAVTYWMNRLQGLDVSDDLFVSLNPPVEPEPSLIHGEFDYDHPVFDAAALAAQRQVEAIQGAGGLWHAGAWLGHGFHEDGLRSAVAVAACLGVAPPWAMAEHPATEGAAQAAAAWSS